MKAKRIVSIVLCILLLVSFSACSDKEEKGNQTLLIRNDWSEDVKNAANDLLILYGKDSANYEKSSYAVFDFDNTTTVFDCEEQLAAYQIEVMAFEIKPESLREILYTDLSDTSADLTEFGYFKGSYSDIADDIINAYEKLWNAYGPFTAKGIEDEKLETLHNDKYWKEFATKLRLMYDLVYDVESATIAYPWILYWFTGMTEEEIYDLGLSCADKYRDIDTITVKWESPADIESKIGQVSYEFTLGVSVTENMKELYKSLDENGIDVWVCSASCTGAVRACIDSFGLHDYITGMLGMTNKTDADGRYINEYDYETGCGFYTSENGEWIKMTAPTKAQPFAEGKVTAISNAIAPEYDNHGPIAGFMDSTGDFNFCTEYETLKLVICFNRATRKVTDGGGLIAELALYQKNNLGYDLKTANDAGDTLYVLQGRDENGKRTFRNSPETLRLGKTETVLFANKDNQTQLDYFINNKLSTKDIIEGYTIKKTAEESGFGFKTGFLKEYSGYHSHR